MKHFLKPSVIVSYILGYICLFVSAIRFFLGRPYCILDLCMQVVCFSSLIFAVYSSKRNNKKYIFSLTCCGISIATFLVCYPMQYVFSCGRETVVIKILRAISAIFLLLYLIIDAKYTTCDE